MEKRKQNIKTLQNPADRIWLFLKALSLRTESVLLTSYGFKGSCQTKTTVKQRHWDSQRCSTTLRPTKLRTTPKVHCPKECTLGAFLFTNVLIN